MRQFLLAINASKGFTIFCRHRMLGCYARCQKPNTRNQISLGNCLKNSGFDKFAIMVPKSKVIIHDKQFIGMPIDKQKMLVMDSFPKNIRSKVDLDTRPIPFPGDEQSICRLELKKCIPLVKQNVNTTPQAIIDEASYHFERGDGLLASDAAWLCSSLQLRLFLLAYDVEADSHSLKREVVAFLKNLSSDLPSKFLILENCHENSYLDVQNLVYIEEFLKAALEFCNLICEINDSKSFNPLDLEKWAVDSNTKFHKMQQLKFKINGSWWKLNELYKKEKGSGILKKIDFENIPTKISL